MNMFLVLAFLFFIGSVSGWILEVLFRHFSSSANPEHKWINPGFCTGPYLPLYGFGLCILYLIASLEKVHLIDGPILNKVVLFAIMAVCMTAIEYLAGVLILKISKIRLWDYTNEWANFQGLICPKFSVAWTLLGALYYFLIHNHILDALAWLSRNPTFSFVIGLFFGVFIVDVAHSTHIMIKLKKFAEENKVVLRYENIKAQIRSRYEKNKKKYNFFRPFHLELPLSDFLRERRETFEAQKLNRLKKK